MVAPVLVFLLKNIASGILAKAGGAIFEKIAGGDDLKLNDKILDALEGLAVSLEEIKSSIAALSDKIAEAVVALRKDDLRDSASAVATQYATVADILATIGKVAKDTTLSDKDRQAKFTELRARLNDCLRKAVETVPALLDRINDSISDPTMDALFHQIAEVALKHSHDVVHYYEQVMTEVSFSLVEPACHEKPKLTTSFQASHYWLAVLKGISLLWMALDEPGIFLPEGKETFERQKKQLETQQAMVHTLLGELVCTIAERLLVQGTPDSKPVVIRIRVAEGKFGLTSKAMPEFRPEFISVKLPDGWTRFDPNFEDLWKIQLGQAEEQALKKGKPCGQYKMRLSTASRDEPDKSLNKEDHGALIRYTVVQDSPLWFIKPSDVKAATFFIGTRPAGLGGPGYFLKYGIIIPCNFLLAETVEKDWSKVQELPAECHMLVSLAE